VTAVEGVVAHGVFTQKFFNESERAGFYGIVRHFGFAHGESELMHRFTDKQSADDGCQSLNEQQDSIAKANAASEALDVNARLAELEERQVFERGLFVIAQAKRESLMLEEQAKERERVGARRATNTDRIEVIKIR
jgi:hypothetical protein